MSSYKGHIAGGIFAFIPLVVGLVMLMAYQPTILDVAVLLSLSVLAALWPDVDIKSKGQQIFYRLFLIVDIALILGEQYKEAAFLGLFSMLPLISKHRGWTHTLWAAVIIPSPFLLLPMLQRGLIDWAGAPYYLACLVGYLSHLALDGMLFKWAKAK